MSGPPTKLDIVDKQSRQFNVKFEAPVDVKGVLVAYKILISKGVNLCVQQILILGGDCKNCTVNILSFDKIVSGKTLYSSQGANQMIIYPHSVLRLFFF